MNYLKHSLIFNPSVFVSTLQHTLQILLQHKATHVLLKAQKDLGFKRQKLRTFDSVRQQPDSEPNTQVFLGSQDMR